jgi:hypothetical protein
MLVAIGIAAMLALFAAGAALWAAGPTLGLILGGHLAVALLVPPLAACQVRLRDRLAVALATAIGVACVWLALLGPGKASTFQWLEVALVLFASSFFLCAIAGFFRQLGISIAGTSIACVVLATGWITWPLWLSAPISQGNLSPTTVAWMLRFHPILLSNGILTFTPPWTEQSIAYQLTILNQDVPVSLPDNPFGFVGLAVILGCIVIVLCRSASKRHIRFNSSADQLAGQ